MSNVTKGQAVQQINYTLVGSAAISLASLYFNATRIGRVANCALVLSIASRVLAGNVESTEAEPTLITPSQSWLPADMRGIITQGVNTVKAVNDSMRKWALEEKARQAAAKANTTPAPQTLLGIPVVPSTETQVTTTTTAVVPPVLPATVETQKHKITVASRFKKLGGLLTKARRAVGKSPQQLKTTIVTPTNTASTPAPAQTITTAAETTTTTQQAASSTTQTTTAATTPAATEQTQQIASTTTQTTTTATATTTTAEQAQETTSTTATATTTTAEQAQEETALTPPQKKYQLIQLQGNVVSFLGNKNNPTDTDTTIQAPETPQEEEAQIQAATQKSLLAPPRVECKPDSFVTGTANQFDLPDGRTACTAIAATALIEMLTGQLTTQKAIDEVLQAGVISNQLVIDQLEGFKTDANQNQLLGWDQCYHGGFKTVLQSPENQDGSLSPSSIPLSADKNSYSEALQALELKATSTGKQQGAILIMYPFTYALSITPQAGSPVIQLFDSHGSLAYDVLGGSHTKASIATFKSIEQLAAYLNAKKPFDPKTRKPERNQFGFYMCQLRSEAEPTTDTSSQPKPKRKGLSTKQLEKRNKRVDSTQRHIAETLQKLQQEAPSDRFLSFCTEKVQRVRKYATALQQEITALQTVPPQQVLTQLLQKTEKLLSQLTAFETCIAEKRANAQHVTTTMAPASNDAQVLTETERAQKFAKVIQKMNSWEKGVEAQIAALQSRTDHTPFELALLKGKLEQAKETLDAVPDATSDIPEHAEAIGVKLEALKAKLREFERLHIEQCYAQLRPSKPQTAPAPATVAPQAQATQAQTQPKPQPTTISKDELAQCTVALKEAQENIARSLHEMQTSKQTAEALAEQAQKTLGDKQWIESQRQRLNNASNSNGEIQQALKQLGEYDQQLTQFAQLLAQKQAIQSATSLEELLKNEGFVKTSLSLVSAHNVDALVYFDSEKIVFLKQEIPRQLQITIELQAKVNTFLKGDPNNKKAGEFNQKLIALKAQLTALQAGLKEISQPNSVQTATKAPQGAPEKLKALIGKWTESIDTWTNSLSDMRDKFNKSDFDDFTDLLDKTNSIKTSATQQQQLIIKLQQNQRPPLELLPKLLEQIQEIITNAEELAHDIELAHGRQLEQLQPEPAQTEPPAAKKSLLTRLLRL